MFKKKKKPGGDTRNWKLDCRSSPVCVAGPGLIPPVCGAQGWGLPLDPHTKYPLVSWGSPPGGNTKLEPDYYSQTFIRDTFQKCP